jgi:putative transposase
MRRKEKFITGEIYHVFNKSIAGYRIFNFDNNKLRFLQTLDYYNTLDRSYKLSIALKRNKYKFISLFNSNKNAVIKFISYVIMPNHYHLQIKVLKENCLSKYLNNIGSSYTKYFNIKNKRKGPLWQSPYKIIRVQNSEQVLHLSRYIHLNPTTSKLVRKPENWKFSSYKEYLNNTSLLKKVLTEIVINNSMKYKAFVETRMDYQIKLKRLKKILLE